jgi:GNAT superfamily N-acetyltransferase
VELQIRLATHDDLAALAPLIDAAIDENQQAYISASQISASRAVMGVDTQLIDDGTYFVVELDGAIAGCGGWSRRATPYGSDHSAGRDDSLLDPATDGAKIRAMYTHPSFTRRGVGRLILTTCEQAAAAEGFSTLELTATLSGFPLYEAYGFVPYDRLDIHEGGEDIPAIRMRKPIEL